MDGFMMNSNDLGYLLIDKSIDYGDKEVHYSVPYPHKYANMVNENGIMSLFTHLIGNSSILSIIGSGMKFIGSQNLTSIVPAALDLEIPSALPKGNYVYLQNILTDLLLGLGREDILLQFINSVIRKGYKPGIITLNPVLIDDFLEKEKLKDKNWIKDLIICFNINVSGFNVFPSREVVEGLITQKPNYKTMGMSIFSSGGASIKESLDYIKSLPLDYVVFGTSKLKNVKSNMDYIRA